MSILEITEEKDEEKNPFIINPEAQKEKIRKIIRYQKSVYWSSSSSLSSSVASCSSSSSSSSSHQSSSSLVKLMKVGSTSLGRLFDMEHTSLATYFEDYSGSPVVKPIPLWGSDTDDEEIRDPWENIKRFESLGNVETDDGRSKFASDGSFKNKGFNLDDSKQNSNRNHRLIRKKSFKRLPGFGFWRSRRLFRFRFGLRRLRIMICGRIFR